MGSQIGVADWEIPPLEFTEDQLTFFGTSTGIKDEAALKRHIEQVQQDALAVTKYRCICQWSFLDFRAATLPAYDEALTLRNRSDAVFLDCGCFCGTDVRKAILDGWPADHIEPAYIAAGRKLFKEAPDASTPMMLVGDLFDAAFLSHSDTVVPSTRTAPPLSELTTLTPLRDRVMVIHAGALFHLFGTDLQLELAQKLLALLSHEPGSVIFGGHVGAEEGSEGRRGPVLRRNGVNHDRWIYSPTTWQQVWHQLDASLETRAELRGKRMVWSVHRR